MGAHFPMGDRTENGVEISSDEEEDPNWKAAIHSIATTTTTTFGQQVSGGGLSNGSTSNNPTPDKDKDNDVEDPQDNSHKLKHYQLKAQKVLDDILEKSLEIVRVPIGVPENDCDKIDCGVRLFKHSPAGIVFDYRVELQGPKKKPKIIPRRDSDENLKMFRRKIKSVAVDGADIVAAAKNAAQKSLARFEAEEGMRKEKAKKEEERIAQLKRIKGERWLPSIARDRLS